MHLTTVEFLSCVSSESIAADKLRGRQTEWLYANLCRLEKELACERARIDKLENQIYGVKKIEVVAGEAVPPVTPPVEPPVV